MGITYNNRPIVTDGLVFCLDAANLKCYFGSGTNISDLSGQSSNGTLLNGVGYTSNNKGGFTFDGVDDLIDIPHGENLNLDTEITQEVWCKVNAYTGRGTLSTKQQSYYLQIDTNSLVQVYTYYNNNGAIGSSNYNESIQSIDLNTWYQIVFTENYLGVRNIYINANLDSTHQAEQSIWKTTNNLQIGSENTTRRFNGTISIVKIYNRALTASEVQQNFNASRGRFGI